MDQVNGKPKRQVSLVILAAAGGLFIVCGVALLGLQVVIWLREAAWFPLPLIAWFGSISVEGWDGVAKIINWFTRTMPTSLMLMLLGAFLIWLSEEPKS